MSEVIYKIESDIARITLNKPEKRNALNEKIIEQLKASLIKAETDGAKAVVLSGAGKDFCSGADLSSLQKISESDVIENLADAENLMGLFLLMRRLKLPIIAAVRGRALAGGCGLATACDIVLAARSARFGYPEVKIGFVPAMVTTILRRNLSEKKAFELITQGFEFSAEEAKQIGLVNEVFDDEKFDEEVTRYVSIYKNISQSAVSLTKKLLYQIDGLSFEASMQIGAEVNTIARFTEDCRKGIQKFLSK
ncbi:MAG: enoyl-CoA hydratase-related protein [Acidobacteriota bacterium]|nr:enoyl-CoA hydratase-related protein [Acidobacteriota bacterium]